MISKDEFCEYIRIHEKSLYNLAYSILRNDADVADCISESIYRAYTKLNSLKDKNNFKSWIMSIVHNTGVEMIRKNSKLIPMDEIESFGEDESSSITSKISVKEAVNKLKQPYHTVVTLYYFECLDIKEIAKITKSNSIAVKQQLSRARKMLKELLKEEQ